jgi:capsular exopolysaccharide synthesis family protein
LVGLAHYLSGQNTLDEVIYDTKIPNFSIILSGPRTPNATEILEKPYFQKMIDYGREHYDYVLIDCAPMAAVIDAAIVAKYCDGAVLVVAQDVANSRLILNSKKQLEVAKITILGVVLNKFKVDKHHYGKYYGKYYGSYYGGQYGHEEDKEEHFNW